MVTKYFNREKYDIFRFNFINLHLFKESRLGSLIFVNLIYLLNCTLFDNKKERDYNYLTLLVLITAKAILTKRLKNYVTKNFVR